MGYNNRNRGYQRDNSRKKRSGCKLHSHYGTDKGLFMTVWKVQNGKMWKGKIFRSAKQAEVAPTVSQNGKEWVSVTIVLSAPMENTVVACGLLNLGNNKAYFKEWNMIANPNANNGGYFGKHISKK